LTIPIREGAYLLNARKVSKYRNNTGYIINSKTDVDEFTREMKIDFEEEILPQLDTLKTIADCVNFYEKYPFWGEHLKKLISNNRSSLPL